jgi:hypothetical protein
VEAAIFDIPAGRGDRPACDYLQLRARRLHVDVWPQSRDSLQPVTSAILDVQAGARLELVDHRQGNPEFRNDRHIRAPKASSRDTHDRRRPLVDRDLAADDAGVAAKSSLPELMAQHDNAGAAACVVAGRVESSAGCEPWLHDSKVVRGNQRPPVALRVSRQSQGCWQQRI